MDTKKIYKKPSMAVALIEVASILTASGDNPKLDSGIAWGEDDV